MVRAPRSAARRAASTPAGPAPITIMSIIVGCPDDEETNSVSMDIIQCREISKRLDAGEEEVGAASHGGECRQARDFFADRALGNFVFERAVLVADDRVAFVTKLVKVPVVRPNVLRELELADEARADHESGDPTLDAVLRQRSLAGKGHRWRRGGSCGGGSYSRAVSRGFMRRMCEPSGTA